MAVIAGIDEAGYGPRLGPLVVSGVAFEVPDAAAGEDLWSRLAPVVSRSVRDRERVAVDDSKRLFSQSGGVRHIERTALAFAASQPPSDDNGLRNPLPQANMCPLEVPGTSKRKRTFRGLLAALAELGEELDAYPWYQGADFAVPLDADPCQIERDADHLRSAAGARFLAVHACPVLVGEFNRLVDSVGTKSATLFMKTARLLALLWHDWGERGLVVHVDKHGGRDRYDLLLHQTFFGARLKTLAEGHDESVYEISDGHRRMTVGFYVHGDARHMPVALASIFSKYLRELFMHRFNAFWAERVPGLKPTAGYAADATRFLRDIAPACRHLSIDERLLIRCL